MYALHEYKTNEEIREMNVYNLNEIIVYYRCKWTQHLCRMNDTRFAKFVCKYIPIGRRNLCRPR